MFLVDARESIGDVASSARHEPCLLCFSLILCAIVVGCGVHDPLGEPSLPAPFPVEVSPSALNLGDIWAADNFRWQLPVKNTSENSVEISELAMSCACLSVSPSTMTLPPGAEGEFLLKFDLTKAAARESAAGQPNIAIQVVPKIEAYDGPPRVWEFTGTVSKLLHLSTTFVGFDDELIAGQPHTGKTVQVESEVPLKSLSTLGGEDVATVDVVTISDTEFAVSVVPNENLKPGAFQTEIKLIPEIAIGETAGETMLTVDGRVACDVDTSPQELRWGIVPIGSKMESRVVVRSRVGKPFSVKSFHSNSEHIVVDLEKSSDEHTTLRLRGEVVAAGNHDDSLSIVVENYDGRTFDLSVPIQYRAF